MDARDTGYGEGPGKAKEGQMETLGPGRLQGLAEREDEEHNKRSVTCDIL